MEKKNEYVEKLLHHLQALERRVGAVKQEEKIPFSFFREAFEKGQEMMGLLHELEMLQIEEMKQQMEKLVRYLSESDHRPLQEEAPSRPANGHLQPPLPEEEAHQEPESRLDTRADEWKSGRRNIYAEGVTLPVYANPRSPEATTEHEAVHRAAIEPATPQAKKPAAGNSLNDTIQAPHPKLDIKRRLSLNDRFYFQRELFDNNREAMSEMMGRLNALDNYDDVERYLKENTSWDFEEATVTGFLELLKKGFE